MSQVSPVRPTRRAAAQRQRRIITSDDEGEQDVQQTAQDDDEEFTPAPTSSPRKRTRRVTQNTEPNTPQLPVRSRRKQVDESIEAQSTASQETEPQRVVKPVRAPRRSIRASRKSLINIAAEPTPLLPTPETSTSPEPSPHGGTALADITEAAVNELPPLADEVKEKPVERDATSYQPVSAQLFDIPEMQAERDANTNQPSQEPLDDDPESAIQEPAKAPIVVPIPVVEAEIPIEAETHQETVKQPTPATTQMPQEKPMDIVVRTRANVATIHQEPSAPKRRIVITYLILTNFKSYAGRQEVGPFHASFSSVVGPNGSGKSNVIDSLLFVFGFRASKMRQGKLSALIHNSAAFPDLDHCEVEVRFQEVIDRAEGGHNVVPDSSLIIARRAFKNNSSKYYINGATSDFTSVTSLLREKGVDLDHKRFLILQGEVESIAQMKPKAASEHDDGLLEYLEDIIGTSKYKTPIEESATETETLNEVCVEKNNRVQHVEKEKKSLEGKKDAALNFIRDENELNMKQSALYQIYINECQSNLEVTQEAAAEVQAQLDLELEQHKGNEAGIKSLTKQHSVEVKAFERMEEETKATLRQLAKADKEGVKFEEKKKHFNTKMKKLEKTISNSQGAISEATSYLQRISDDLQRHDASLSELELRLQSEDAELTQIRDSLQGKTQGLSEQIAEKQKSLEPWTQQINEKQSAIALAQSELAILKEKDNAGAKELSAIEARITQLADERQAKTGDLEQCITQKETCIQEAQSHEKQIQQLDKKEPEIRSKLSTARQKADEARASLASSQTQGNVLSGLMRLKESGRIQGFHGRLGNLGAIEPKYDVAISTACPALDNLVVDSVEVGQQCIEYLRKNNLGRANFILLNRLSQRDLGPIETPENAPRLFDIVRAKDDKFLPAFYSVLQNTLVANDLQQANRIAYGAKRWRVVTLDGQLIDKSGTMSGGGTRVAKGAMSSKIVSDTSKEQVNKLDVDQATLEAQLQELQKEKEAAQISHREAQNAVPELESRISKLRLEIGSTERNIADAEKRRNELAHSKIEDKSNKAQLEILAKQIASLEREAQDLQQHTTEIDQEIKSLQDKIMEVGGVKLRGQKAKVDGLREQMNSINEEIASAEVSRSKTEKQKAKNEKIRAESEAEMESIAQGLEEVDAETRSHVESTSGSRKQAEEAQEALEAKKEELIALKAELDQKTAELNESRGVEIEMRNRLEENQKVLVENQKRLKYWVEKLGGLKLQNISDIGEELEPQEMPSYTQDELADLDKNVLKGEIAILEEKTQNVNVELSVLAEYRRRVEEHASRSSDLAEAVSARDTAKKRCEDLRRLRLEGFMEGFSAISLRLKEMYQMITMGGNAELELVDSLDPFSEGILFSVMPPKKSWKNISNLSGGEKTLSSLALVFALHHYKPTPLYVMDEIDAALDFRNVSIVASYIKERTKNAQFVVISLRNNMFELASRLVGVYKVSHMTKSVTVENKDYIVRRP